jgi:hypothetical protein
VTLPGRRDAALAPRRWLTESTSSPELGHDDPEH